MGNLKTFLNLAKKIGSTAIVDEDGNVLGVMLSPEEFEKLSGHDSSLLRQSKHQLDVEEINRQILVAQLSEEREAVQGPPANKPISPIAQRNFEEKVKGVKGHVPGNLPFRSDFGAGFKPSKMPDLRQEVIDPSFDFDSPDEI